MGQIEIDKAGVVIEHANWPGDKPALQKMLLAYRHWLGEATCFVNFDSEVNNLPGAFTQPNGCLMVARKDQDLIGMVGMVPIDANMCELKRLYVKPDFRRLGLGRLFSVAVLDFANNAGYRTVRLETLGRLNAARTLYADLGFVDEQPVSNAPVDSTLIMTLDLI
jgi:GNAT superfamily N-acetyltransferase